MTRKPNAAVVAGVALLALAVFGCMQEADPVRYQAPLHSRAAWVLEPPTIQIGDVATLELAAVTRPNHRVRPFATPRDVAGIWILDVETLPVTREVNRWIHRTRVRIRPREVGRFEWPSTPIEVEGDGTVETLTAEGLALDVVSVLPQYVGKLTPFGLEPLAASKPTQRWAWAAGGATFALACLALVWLVRRESTRTEPPTPSARSGASSWETALDALETSRIAVERDPIRACASASIALRSYMEIRFGVTRAIASTTEELAQTRPPFAATSRWSGFIALLRRLDDARFPAPSEDSSGAQVREIIDDVASFVRDSIPIAVTR